VDTRKKSFIDKEHTGEREEACNSDQGRLSSRRISRLVRGVKLQLKERERKIHDVPTRRHELKSVPNKKRGGSQPSRYALLERREKIKPACRVKGNRKVCERVAQPLGDEERGFSVVANR